MARRTFKSHYGGTMNSESTFGPYGITAYKGRLRMPRVYTRAIPVSCAYDGTTRWMDYGRMHWYDKPAYRVYLRRPVGKPPRTNRGVSQWTTLYFRCHSCDSASARAIRVGERPTGPHYCYDCQDDMRPEDQTPFRCDDCGKPAPLFRCDDCHDAEFPF